MQRLAKYCYTNDMNRTLEYNIDNYYALALCILEESYSIDKALAVILDGKTISQHDYSITKEDVEHMIALHDSGVSYARLAEVYNIGRDAVIKRIIRYNKRKELPDG